MAKLVNIEYNTLIKLKAGEHQAFIRVYDAYHKGLYHFVRKYLQDDNAAEDIVHDVFMKLWEIKDRIDPERPLINYLYRITRNAVYKELKKIEESSLLTGQLSEISSLQQEAPVDTLYQHHEYERLLETAVNQLPLQRQRVFKLCRQQGKTYEEAAKQLSISPHTVKEHMSLAMKDIKIYICKNTDLIFVWILIWDLISIKVFFS